MVMDFTDNTLWNKLLHKGSADQAPAAFTSTHEARRHSLSTNGAGAGAGAGAAAHSPLLGATEAGHDDAMRRKRSISSTGENSSLVVSALSSVPPSLHRQVSDRFQALTPVAAEQAFYERDLFLAMARPVLETLVVLYDRAAEDQLISRILKGLWDFITICEEFNLHQMLNSTVQLLSFRCRGLMDAARRVPTKPFSRRNILAHKAQYQQLRQDTGVDLHALVSQNFDALINTKTALLDDKTEHTHSHAASLVPHHPHVSVPPLTWSYASMIRGELLLRLILQAASKVPYALQNEACSSLLMVLAWVRSRGALPSTLALVHREVTSPCVVESSTPQLASPRQPSVDSTDYSLPPSTYAHRCYLEAYGLALERSGQSGVVSSHTNYSAAHMEHARHASSNQGSGWLGFLFAAPADDASSHHHAMMSAPAGTLDLPNLYRNTNASAWVDMTGNPLRPDDELLKACLEASDPTQFFFQAITELGEASTESLLQTMFTTLSRMLEGLTTAPRMPIITAPSNSQRSIPAFKRSASANSDVIENGSLQRSDAQTAESEISSVFEGVEEENACFPEHMLSTEFMSSSEVKELDAVVLLEWICNIVLKNGQTLLLYWPGLYGTLLSNFVVVNELTLILFIYLFLRVSEAYVGRKC